MGRRSGASVSRPPAPLTPAPLFPAPFVSALNTFPHSPSDGAPTLGRAYPSSFRPTPPPPHVDHHCLHMPKQCALYAKHTTASRKDGVHHRQVRIPGSPTIPIRDETPPTPSRGHHYHLRSRRRCHRPRFLARWGWPLAGAVRFAPCSFSSPASAPIAPAYPIRSAAPTVDETAPLGRRGRRGRDHPPPPSATPNPPPAIP